MKITKIDVFLVSTPFVQPQTMAMWTSYKKDHAIVRIQTDEGICGIGESVPLVAEFGEPVESIQYVIQDWLAPAIVGEDPFNTEAIFEKMFNAVKGHLFAKCAIDFALYDLMAKALKVPLYKLLGGKTRETVPVTWVIGIKKPEEAAKEALSFVERGFKELKLKAGKDWRLALDTLKAVREAVGWDIPIRVDPNQAWSVARAISVTKRMERYELQLMEQPTPAWDLDGLAEVAKAVDTPILIDEGVRTPEDAVAAIRKDAADMINLKIGKIGGIFYSSKINAIAEASDIPCLVGSMLEGSIGTAASAHFALAAPNLKFAHDLIGPLFRADDVVKDPIKVEKGCVEVREKPGIGLELDEGKLEYLKYKGRWAMPPAPSKKEDRR
ncbi:MAG: enolase C-terminal domain-like protein [Candidatus Bathyarchaeia archaeon]